MAALHEIRADSDRDTIMVHQAYPAGIADAALAQGGRATQAKRLLPPERTYPLPETLARRITPR